MANVKELMPFVLKHEGGYVNHKNDPGGATNMGVTIGVWKQQGYDKDGDRDVDVMDLKLLTKEDASIIMKKNYWNRWLGDNIKSQAVANILIDWVWCSGKWGIIIPQRLLGLKEDGVVGYITLEALNETIKKDEKKFVVQLYKVRYEYIEDIIKKNAKLVSFRKGWYNRMKDLEQYNKKYLK